MIGRFPNCLYLVTDHSIHDTHGNIIRLIASDKTYDLDMILNNIEWTVSDYYCMKSENEKRSIGKFTEVLKSVLNKIKYNCKDNLLYMKNDFLLKKFLDQISNSDKFWTHITTVDQLEIFKKHNITLPNCLYQQFLDRNNFSCFKWVHKNININDLKLTYTFESFDEYHKNCDYLEELLEDAENIQHFMLYFYYNKESLNDPVIKDSFEN